MKKPGKLSINPEKVIKNDQLVNLRGGDYGSGTGAAASPSGSCFENISRAEAIFMATCEDPVNGTNCHGGHWCCDSCGSVPWLPCQ